MGGVVVWYRYTHTYVHVHTVCMHVQVYITESPTTHQHDETVKPHRAARWSLPHPPFRYHKIHWCVL